MRLDAHADKTASTPHLPGLIAPTSWMAAGDSDLAASWQRCADDYGLVPDALRRIEKVPQDALDNSLEAHHRLLRIARVEMNSFYAQVGNSHNTVLLTDAQGLVLEQISDPAQKGLFHAKGLAPGYFWDERNAGTNGPGTCLLVGRPVTVYRDEHYFKSYAGLSCSAAPIWGPDGKLLAVLDATCFDCTDSRQSQLHTMLLVSMSARVIEQIYFANSFREHWIVRFHSRAELVGLMHDAMLAIDADGRVCGADSLAAGLLGRRSAADLVGHNVSELFAFTTSRFFDQAHSMPCRIWATQGQATGGRYFLSVRSPHRSIAIATRAQDSSAHDATTATPQLSDRRKASTDYPAEGERDPVMAYNVWCAEQVMNKGINILLQGATGTGKGTLAKAIHQRSNRNKRPFIAMCCAAIPETLAESELFGYEAGAFTGARSGGMRGKIVASNGGTLFLDEIGDMPLSLQARLLHVLEEKEVTPLGSTKPIAVDLHVVSASNHNLQDLIEKGLFREDLYYRLNGITLTLPPLRERQDLEDLIVSVCQSENNDRPTRVSAAALDCMLAYPWPGNIRELRNVVRTALALSSDGNLGLDNLPWSFRSADTSKLPGGSAQRPTMQHQSESTALPAEGDDAVHSEIMTLLQYHRWNISHAADALGISRNTLYRRMHRLGILTPRTK